MLVPGDRPWFKFWPEGVTRHIDYPNIPLFEFLSSSCRRHPDKIAFSCQGNSLTYNELDILTGKLASGLHNLGAGRQTSVVLLLPNSLEFVIGYYGILKAGSVVVPINPLFKTRELIHHLSDCGAIAIITDTDSYPIVREVKDEANLNTIVLTDSEGIEGTISLQEVLARHPSTPPAFDLMPTEDVAAIEYTGGTTGLPHGVMLTHYNLVANAIQNAVWLGWNDEDVVIGLLPFYHSWGACTCVNSPVYCGARVVVLPRFDIRELLRTIEEERATILHGAGSMFTMLIDNPIITEYDLSSLKYVKAGAMPIPPAIKDRWEQLTGVKMILGYGLSEASPETHNSPPQRVKSGSVGIPIIDTDARIVDEETGETELPPGEVGELIIRGPQVMKAYLKRHKDSEEALRNGWLYTGDLALMDEEGYFYIVDRKKEIMKYKGYTISPAEVEAILCAHPDVKECAVVGKPDALAGEIPKAYVVLRQGRTLCEEELIRFCEQQVSAYKKIREIEFVKEIPRSQAGKVLRRVLRDRNGGEITT